MVITKPMALHRLVTAGHRNVAEQLNAWRNKYRTNGGWDGWFRGQFPDLIDVVWE